MALPWHPYQYIRGVSLSVASPRGYRVLETGIAQPGGFQPKWYVAANAVVGTIDDAVIMGFHECRKNMLKASLSLSVEMFSSTLNVHRPT